MFWHAAITPATGESQEDQHSASLLYLEICPSKRGEKVTPFKWSDGCFGFYVPYHQGDAWGSSVKWLTCHLGVTGDCLALHCNRTETGISGREKNPFGYFHSFSLGIIPKGLGLVTACEMNLSRFSQALSISGAAVPVKVFLFKMHWLCGLEQFVVGRGEDRTF